jgi:hypothetical protein
MSDNTSPKDEEIDLGLLFSLIGKGFGKIGDFVTGIFRFCENVLLQILLFFIRHFIKFSVAVAFGMIFGIVIDYSGDPEYEASMVVKPNYNSGRQLYKNIEYYDELVKQRNTDLLVKTFDITVIEAKSLVSFEIKPVINETYMLSTYDEFLSSIDSTVALNFEYESYTQNFEDYSFNEHEIIVTSLSNGIFPKLENTIVDGIITNSYYEKLEGAEKVILDRNEDYLVNSLMNVDTLRRVYREVLIAEANKEISNGTNINMASGLTDTKELDLFTEEVRINQDLDQLNRIRVKDTKILNVISSFQTIGFEKNQIWEKSTLRFAVLAFIVLLVSLIVFELKEFFKKFVK